MKSRKISILILSIILLGSFSAHQSPLQAQESVYSESIKLSVVKTDDTDTANPNDVLTYRIVLTNHSAEAITIQATDRLPNFLIPLATSPEATADPDTRTVLWDQISIPANGEITLGMRAQIVEKVPANHIIQNNIDVTVNEISITASDSTHITTGITNSDTASVIPTATTGSSNIIVVLGLLALGLGIIGIRKLIFH